MQHETLDITTCEPGVYAVKSLGSDTVYLLDTRLAVLVRRVKTSNPFPGDNEWGRLTRLASGPDLRASEPDPTDVRENVVRVGSRHRYEWDPGLLHHFQWRIGRVVERIDGPLSDDDLAALLPHGTREV